MASLDQMKQALIKANAAGNVEDARALAMAIKQASTPSTPDAIDQGAIEAMKPTALERFGRGAEDVVQGVKQLYQHAVGTPEDAAAIDKTIQEQNAQYEKGRSIGLQPGEKPKFDWMRLGGNVAATAPVMLIPGGAAPGVLARGASMAAQGGAAAAAMPVTGDGNFLTQKAVQTGIGAVTAPLAGFGLQKLGNFIGNKVVRPGMALARRGTAAIEGKAINPNAVMNADGTFTQAGAEAMKKLGITVDDLHDDAIRALQKAASSATKEAKALTPEQQIRAAMIHDVTGEPATLGQVTRDFAQQQTEQELKKINVVGTELRSRFAKQNAGLLKNFQDIKTQTGGMAPNEYQAGNLVSDAVKTSEATKDSAVSNLYKAYRNSGGADAAIPDKAIADRLGTVADEIGTENIPSPVLSRLKEFGFLGGTRTKLLTVNEADKLNRLINNNNPGFGPASKALRELKDSLNEALISAPDEGASASKALIEARKAAAASFKQKDIPAVRAILDGKVRPEDIYDKFVRKGGIDDLTQLKDYLGKGPAPGAWNELRSQTLEDVFQRATRRAAKDELDNVLFSGAQFKKAVDSLGEEKLKVLFTPEELAKLDRLSKVAEWRIPMADVVNTSNTSSAMWNMIDKMLAYLPGRSGMVLRGMGRMGQIGAQQIEQEAAAKAAMVPEATISGQAEKAAREGTAATVRKASNMLRGPSFFSLGTERQRNAQ